MKQELIEWLEDYKWYPENPTPHEFEVAHHFNALIDDMKSRLILLKENERHTSN